ncbi:hypothetical protein IWX46DRAFT_623517 [Phyllosticta citricarpa]|uniref:Secreted protein n=1 Tax=Phyllosticta citricarpa TaxID=55181 RepID=A0ABR1MR07_9PEZI
MCCWATLLSSAAAAAAAAAPAYLPSVSTNVARGSAAQRSAAQRFAAFRYTGRTSPGIMLIRHWAGVGWTGSSSRTNQLKRRHMRVPAGPRRPRAAGPPGLGGPLIHARESDG